MVSSIPDIPHDHYAAYWLPLNRKPTSMTILDHLKNSELIIYNISNITMFTVPYLSYEINV